MGCEEFKLDSVSGKRTKSIYCMDKYGNFIKEYESVKEASLEVNISACMISANLNGRKKSAGGYIWKYNF